MSEWRGTGAWALQCQCCFKLLYWSVRLTLRDDQAVHWNHEKRDLCGPVERVELRSEVDGA